MPKIEAATTLPREDNTTSRGSLVVSPGAILSNGRLSVAITGRGTGFTSHGGSLLTRWAGDPVEDRDGSFVYLRDLDSREVWTAGTEPLAGVPDAYESTWRPGVFTIERRDHGIETKLEVAVMPDADAEVRRVTLRNRSRRARRIEITSFAPVVIHDAAADASHPAFSRLFVQTEFDSSTRALVVSRRPRHPDEQHPWLVHVMTGAGRLEHETDRDRFIGRGGTTAAPRALSSRGRLSGTTGNVLDPIVSLRRVVKLEPGGIAHVFFGLGAAFDREAALELARVVQRDADAAFDLAEHAEVARLALAGVTPALEERRQALAVATLYGRFVESVAGRVAAGTKPVSITDQLHAAGTATPSPSVNRVRIAAHATAHHNGVARLPAQRSSRATSRRRTATPEPLQFWNGYGGFSAEGTEYVIRLAHHKELGLSLPPAPWVNVLANESFGALVSETGAGCTWSRNSREHRLTTWSNDPLLDPHGEALYLRDEASGESWSPLPGPRPAAADYEMRHGFGVSRCTHSSHGLEQVTEIFVPAREPVKIVRLRITNASAAPRRLAVFSYQRLVLGSDTRDHARTVEVEQDRDSGILLARNPASGPYAGGIAFSTVVASGGVSASHVTRNREAFLGVNGNPSDPRALHGGTLRDVPAGGDPCFARQIVIEIAPSAVFECAFLLGETMDLSSVRELVERLGTGGAIEAALLATREVWAERVSAVAIRTPRPAIDLMVNGWLAYQTLACRLWGRTAFYQSGGALGFRDQLQDAASLLMWSPGILREQILTHASHQFVEGDVLHWWHPPDARGIRTRFADDLLWLPWLTAGYVTATGDAAVLDEQTRYVTARALEDGEDEAFLVPEDSGESGDVYEHCCRAIDRSLATGIHGLPLFGTGDWNDGMNRVGREGRGESVWMGFFLYTVLGEFLALCERRADRARIERYVAHREHLKTALNDAGWDGGWYRRGYYDDGTALGTKDGDECRIDALAQAWAVLSGAAPKARARRAIDAVEQRLVSERQQLIKLLDPPFEHTPHDPGYIKGYVPGVRENGGQYTHAALWVVRAVAELGRNDRAAALLEMLSPVRHTRTRAQADQYRVEPYVIAADVYGAAPHVGRGGWTWYTGSAGWMLRVTLESVLGVRLEQGRTLTIAPCVPDQWPGFDVRWTVPGESTVYEIVVRNPKRRARRVVTAKVDGQRAAVVRGVARIAIEHDQRAHRIDVVLG